MKYTFISENKGRYKVGLMCNVLNISRSGYYAWRKSPESHRSRKNRKLAVQRELLCEWKAWVFLDQQV